VVPLQCDGTKRPLVRWQEYQQRLPTDDELRRWFGNGHAVGIGVVCGSVSGSLELIDFDSEAERIFPAWCELVRHEEPELLDCLSVSKTPKGYHVRYRSEGEIPGNTKLAMSADGKTVLIETRGEGGYGVAPGSPAEVHQTQIAYTHYCGPKLSRIKTISAAEREVLIRCAQSFDQSPAESPTPQTNGAH